MDIRYLALAWLFWASIAGAALETKTNYTVFNGGLAPIGAVVARYCGQNAESGMTFMSPFPLDAPPVDITNTACDTMAYVEEQTAQKVLLESTTLRPAFIFCRTTAELGQGETITYQLRSAGTDVPSGVCQMSQGKQTCEATLNGFYKLQGGTATAMEVTQKSDNIDDRSMCSVVYVIN